MPSCSLCGNFWAGGSGLACPGCRGAPADYVSSDLVEKIKEWQNHAAATRDNAELQRKNEELVAAIKSALAISDLWRPTGGCDDPEKKDEYTALVLMHDKLLRVVADD